jgi:hypothetical protein
MLAARKHTRRSVKGFMIQNMKMGMTEFFMKRMKMRILRTSFNSAKTILKDWIGFLMYMTSHHQIQYE